MFFNDSRPDRRKRAAKLAGPQARQLEASPIPPAKPYALLTWDELATGGDRALFFDVESYPNYFLVSFKCYASGKVICFEDTPAGYFINGVEVDGYIWCNALAFVLHRFLIVGFNSRHYDVPITLAAVAGMRAGELNLVTGEIINEGLTGFDVERKYGLKSSALNHIDLIEVAPLDASLKLYGARLHSERLQDLPFKPATILTPEQAAIVRDYNVNDLDVTELLFRELEPQIRLREELGREYGQDLRSKSDAQIAEAVIGSELRRMGARGARATIEAGWSFRYRVPNCLQFQTPQLQHVLEVVRSAEFVVGNGGYADTPKAITELEIKLGSCVYRMGNGGLHSSERSVCHVASERKLIIDRDVESYYPNIILTEGLYPQHLGEAFLKVFQKIVWKRINAKRTGDKKTSDSLKITINGTFGKLGNFYSLMYAPDLLIQVTIGGQLRLLMLIEMVELAGISVISANTDGIVIDCPPERYDDLMTVVIAWEERTGLITEETRYKAIYSRDVNNYIAVKEDGKCKLKGVYSERGSALNSVLSKNPETLICSDAVQAFLTDGVPLAHTIQACRDVRRFTSVRTVKGGAHKAGVYLGKVVRWYYAKGETGTINYVLSGNSVPKTEGARPLMNLPAELPADLDFDWYVNEATEMLFDLGHYRRPAIAKLF